MAERRSPAVLRSFNYAFEGVIHVLRTQRNMRIHFAIAGAVLVLAFIYDVTRLELIALMISIAFVLIAEMVNTAVEATIDLSTPSFDPLAKIAKDIAAGAVLIAAANAVAVGYLVLADRLARPSARLVNSLGDAPINLTVIALVLTMIVVIAIEGADRQWDAPARRPSVWPCGPRVRLLGGDHVHRQRAPHRRLLRRADHGPARLPDPRRGGDPHAVRGRGGRGHRYARHPHSLPSLPMTDQELYEAALAASEAAYAPYSRFLVGAAALLRDGRVVTGVNVENASYPLGMCAERCAIARAVVEGAKPGDFEAIGITASPCGACRQWLAEFGFERVAFMHEGELLVRRPDELLPDSFEL